MRWIGLVAQLGGGAVQPITVPADVWLTGPAPSFACPGFKVTRVELDPGGIYPDVEPAHGVWTR